MNDSLLTKYAMVLLWLTILFGSMPCCWTQTTTQYTMHRPSLTAMESVGIVTVGLSRTGGDTSQTGTVFLTTEDDSAVGGQDFVALNNFQLAFAPNELAKSIDIVITNDDIGEFKEKFKVTIVSASDGVPGSQPSTEIIIEENDYCIEIPVPAAGSSIPFYVSPWNPVSGKPIVFKNTIATNNHLRLLFSSTPYFTTYENVYQLNIEFPLDMSNTKLIINRGTGNDEVDVGALNILRSVVTETISVTFDQASGTFTLTYPYDAPNNVLTLRDSFGVPITVKHIFASSAGASSAGGDFTLCNMDPIRLQKILAEQSSNSQTLTTALASRATDGNRASLVAGAGTCSVTDDSVDPWWRVDLGKEYEVSVVNFFSVADADISGLDDDDIINAQVYIGSCEATYIEDLKLCGSAPADIQSDATLPTATGLTRFPTSVPCSSMNTYGRYVYIRLDTTAPATAVLALCEVDVYGTAVPFGSETTVLFSSPSYSVGETETSGVVPVTVEVAGPGFSCATVDVHTVDGTATSSGSNPGQSDYTSIPQASPSTLTFDPANKMRTVNVAITPDTQCEDIEKFNLGLSNAQAAILGSVTETTVSITDDDITQYALVIPAGGFTVEEGGAPLTITVTRSATAENLSAEGSVVLVSEENNNVQRQTVKFVQNDESEGVSIGAFDDEVFELDTTFNVRLETVGECNELVSDKDTATVTVKDDDSRFYFDDQSLTENTISIPENTGTYRIKIRREGTLRDKTVNVAVDSADALQGQDFTLVDRSVSFISGSDEAYVTVSIEDDYLKEGNERFDLILSDPNGNAENIKEPSRISVEIIDDDDIYQFFPNYYDVSEASSSVRVCLKREGALTNRMTISLETRDVTTQANADYAVTNGGLSVTFSAGSPEACVQITIRQDSIVELDETFLVHILNKDIQTEYNTQAIVNIQDDSDVYISFGSERYQVSEDEGSVTVYITKSGDIRKTVSATITSDSISTEEGDFQSVSDSIRIPAGVLTMAYEVVINSDNIDESDEQFKLILTNAVGARISNSETIVTIKDSYNQPPDQSDSVLSGSALAGIIVGAVVVTIASALGIALCFAYLAQRRRAPVLNTSRPAPLAAYPGGYGNGPYGYQPNNQQYLSRPRPIANSNYR